MIRIFFVAIAFLFLNFNLVDNYGAINPNFDEGKGSGVKKIDYSKDKSVLFFISHNKSSNIVIYKLNRDAFSKQSIKKAIDVFWFMRSKGNITESLTYIEKKTVFGYTMQTIKENEKYRIRLNAMKERFVEIIKNSAGNFESFITINNIRIKLKNIFVKFEYTLFGPEVEYLDFMGTNPKTGERIKQRYLMPQ